ncbi:MAG: recombinase family protein [Candidatus Nanoarchaeia archaeon]|nr:recombinase family protein [Candidatus Nanoarchaeia archaeon]
MDEPTNVAIYLRVSTMEQAENGWSIEGQYKEIREFCGKENLKVVRVYRDLGFSGSDMERPGLQKLLEQSWSGEYTKVIIWKYDRLSRNNMDFPALLHFLNKNEVKVVSIKEPTPNDDSPYNEFVIGILGLISSLERRVFMMRSKMGMRVRLERGFYKGSHSPYGYNYNMETGHLEFNPIESKDVKEIFEKYLELKSILQVKHYCNSQGFPTKRSGKWELATLWGILRNRVYLGYYIYNGIETYHKELQLIPEELFEKVQEQLKERSQYGVKNRKFSIEKEEITNAYDGSDPKIHEFIQSKNNMPLCPRCNNNLTVFKHGWRTSPVVGRLQQYKCNHCKYEFTPYPHEEVKKDMPQCPKCYQKTFVSKKGFLIRKSHPKIQRYSCSKCNHYFGIKFKYSPIVVENHATPKESSGTREDRA